jgi:hypothetical protein
MVPKDDLAYMEFSMQHVEVLRLAITATAGIEAAKPTGLRSAQIGLRVTFLSAFGVFGETRDFLQRIAVQLNALLQAARRSYSSAFLSMAALASGSSSQLPTNHTQSFSVGRGAETLMQINCESRRS